MNKRVKRELTYAEKQQQYLVARRNLLLMLILTVVNVALYFTGSETMMLFSATVPFYGVVFADIYWMYSAVVAVGYGLAAVCLVAYLACWFFSKKRYEWMIGALVLFIIDTIAMIGLYIGVGEVSGVLDVLIHAWVLYYLFIGVKYGRELKNAPVEGPIEGEAVEVQEVAEETQSEEEIL